MWTLPLSGNAQEWKDSLYVRISEAHMDRTSEPGKAYLKFSIQVCRPVTEWNNNDRTIGASDFYFGRADLNMSEVFSSLVVENEGLHPCIGKDNSKSMKVDSRFVLGKAHIFLSYINPLDPAKLTVDPENTWITLCKIKMELRDPSRVDIGLIWNRESSGMITTGNNPILENFMGDLDKIPDPHLSIPEHSVSGSYCDGEDVTLYAKAVSTGENLQYYWEELDKTTGQYIKLMTVAGSPGNENMWENATNTSYRYKYQIRGIEGDTLVIRGAEDSVTFRCRVTDDNLGGTEADYTRTTPDIVINVRPKVRVVLEGYDNGIKKYNSSNDTIYHCTGNDADIRVAFYIDHIVKANDYNRARTRFRDEVGTIHVCYKYVDLYGSETLDTVTILSKDLISFTQNYILHNNSSAKLSVMEDGKYFVEKVWSDFCGTGEILSGIDTVTILSRNSQSDELTPIYYVAGSPAISVVTDVPANARVEFSPGSKVGELSDDYDYYAAQGAVGTDTLIYQFSDGVCQVTAIRLVHVLSEKSIGIKVFLEGPYVGNGKMRSLYVDYFPGASGSEYFSPYQDQLRTPRPFPDFGNEVIVDWVYIELWNYPPNGLFEGDPKAGSGQMVDSTSALLLTDGTVASVNGNRYLSFKSLTENKYYVIIKHKSHVPIMSADPVEFFTGTGVPDATHSIDFTSQLEKTFNILGTSSAQRAVLENNGKFLMYGGDLGDTDGIVTVSDLNSIIEKSLFIGYDEAEITLDGQVTVADLNLCQKNMNVYKKY